MTPIDSLLFIFANSSDDRIGPSSPIGTFVTRLLAQALSRRGIRRTIPERCDQRQRRATHPGRHVAFDAAIYRRRNVIERCVNRLKQWRGIATRYEKRAVNYRAMVIIAALMIWLTS